LRLFTDAGRVCRPLFIVDQQTQQILLNKEHIERIEELGEEKKHSEAWEELLNTGIIEYVDAAEEETILIAMSQDDLHNARTVSGKEEMVIQRALRAADASTFDPSARVKSTNWSQQYTHMEVHPSMILGVCASIVPFPDHNQVCHLGSDLVMILMAVSS